MKRFSLRYLLPTITTLALIVAAAAFSLPHGFEAGEVISAAEMNENFAAFATAVSDLEAQVALLEAQAAAEEAAAHLPSMDGYFAYAWVDGSDGVPNPDFSFNPTGDFAGSGGTDGVYEIVFGGDHPDLRNVQVTTYGETNVNCKVLYWTTEAVNVVCLDGAAYTAADFTIWVVS